MIGLWPSQIGIVLTAGSIALIDLRSVFLSIGGGLVIIYVQFILLWDKFIYEILGKFRFSLRRLLMIKSLNGSNLPILEVLGHR